MQGIPTQQASSTVEDLQTGQFGTKGGACDYLLWTTKHPYWVKLHIEAQKDFLRRQAIMGSVHDPA